MVKESLKYFRTQNVNTNFGSLYIIFLSPESESIQGLCVTWMIRFYIMVINLYKD